MRKLRNQPSDSFDLLLDTLCNVFGSIILIACLLAMITREPNENPVSAVVDVKGTGVLLEIRLEKAREELQRLQILSGELKLQDQGSTRALSAERDDLRATVERLRFDRDERTLQAQQDDIPLYTDPGGDLAGLREQAKKEGQRLADIMLQLQAVVSKTTSSSGRVEQISRQMQEIENDRIQQLRMPREGRQTLDSRPVILKFGEIFPLSDEKKNAYLNVRRVVEADGSFTAHPIQTKGMFISRDGTRLKELFLRHKQTGGYITLYVYPDSYVTFRDLVRLIQDAGIPYGVEACTEHEVLNFSKRGSAPPPL
ncbi:hypothetical protein WJU23_02210 [Prosthecobacter sp. SYSU 5D2]|uniref:hypothetical protein n=1 Tax=Prosthecobacter sp. SYSU 5D2 TaxID=3134134 RepID=UPI0031FEC011